MRTFLIVVASIIPIAGAVPYLWSSLRRKTKPKFATWSTWTLLNGINAAAAFTDGALPTAVSSLAGTVATGLIALVALRNGFTTYTRFDAVCQGLALLGIPFWLLAGEPAAAVVMVIVVNVLASLPTVHHAWQAPHEENPAAWLGGALGSLIILACLEQYTFIAVALPLSILVSDSFILLLVLTRRGSKRLVKHAKSARVKS